MKRRRNDKGFSLVEMIVVVLIMAIIAVALAPQVMKWVGTARKGADFQSKEDVKSVAQVALAEFESKVDAAELQDENYNITSSGVVADDGTDDNTGMIAIIEYYLNGSYPPVQDQSGKVYQIQMQAEGRKVTVEIVDGTY